MADLPPSPESLRKQLLYKFYLLTMRGESMRWLPVRKWLLDRLLGRNHAGLEIHANVFVTGWWNLRLGDRVTINRDCTLLAHGGLTIGDESMIAHACSIITTEHGTATDTPMRDQPMRIAPVFIGKNVWLGARAIILGGADLAEGTIVAAGAVVKGTFPKPHATIGGVPARVLRCRGHAISP